MNPVLEATGLEKSSADAPRLTVCDLKLRAGEAVALLGPAGAGKSTLLAMLGGLLPSDAGEVRLAGQRFDFNDPAACAALRHVHLGFMAQRVAAAPRLAIETHLRRLAEGRGLGHAAAADRARELLFRVGLAGHLTARPTQLTPAQRQLLAIAHALVHRPAVVLADEPVADLPEVVAETVLDLLITQAHLSGVALLVAQREPCALRRFDRSLILDAGRLHDDTRGLRSTDLRAVLPRARPDAAGRRAGPSGPARAQSPAAARWAAVLAGF